MKMTSKKVKQYMEWRTDEKLRHCPDAIATVCNDLFQKYHGKFGKEDVEPKDFMKLLFFNDPIPSLHTHSYSFNTATGRHLINRVKEYYYEQTEY